MGFRPQMVFWRVSCCLASHPAHLRTRQVCLPLLDGSLARRRAEQVHALVVHVLDGLPDRRVALGLGDVATDKLQLAVVRDAGSGGNRRHRHGRIRRGGVVWCMGESSAPGRLSAPSAFSNLPVAEVAADDEEGLVVGPVLGQSGAHRVALVSGRVTDQQGEELEVVTASVSEVNTPATHPWKMCRIYGRCISSECSSSSTPGDISEKRRVRLSSSIASLCQLGSHRPLTHPRGRAGCRRAGYRTPRTARARCQRGARGARARGGRCVCYCHQLGMREHTYVVATGIDAYAHAAAGPEYE